MKKFRPRSSVVEAVQFTGEMDAEIERWLGDAFESWVPSMRRLVMSEAYVHGVVVNAGDWIVKDGDRFQWVPSGSFEYEYELVPDPAMASAETIIRRQVAKEIAAAIRASDVTWSGPGVAPDSGSWAIEVDDAVAIVERIGAK